MPMANEGGAMMAKLVQNPLLLQPGCEDLFTQSIMEMQAHPRFDEAMAAAAATDDFWDDDDEFMSWLRPYNVQDGVLTIPVHGVLLNKFPYKFGSWVTGYTYIERAFERGMADPEVHTLAFDIDSPGGEVAGNFELVEKIAEEKEGKTVLAFANDHAYSAAYSLATAADSITMARSGGVGSVGVVTAHMDVSERMEQMGVKVTFIYAGKHKVDGNPYQKLPDAVKDRIQDRIDRIYGEFVALVAENRGMEEQAVRDTEALTFDKSNAVEIGFADKIGSMDKELAALSQAATEMEHMATKTTTTPAAEEGGSITQAQMDAAVETAKAEGHKDGMAAERQRISGIFGLEEAKNRPAAAKMAVNAGMTVEDAKAALEAMPEEQAAAPAKEEPKAQDAPAPTPFAAQMDGPGVGAQVEEPKAEDGKVGSDDLLGSYAMLTGRDLRPQKAN